MSDQRALRRKIAKLEAMQDRRIELADETRAAVDRVINEKQREIDNLYGQLVIRGVA